MKTLLGCSKSNIITGLSKETRKIPNKQPNIVSQRSTKRRTKAAQSQKKKKIQNSMKQRTKRLHKKLIQELVLRKDQ